MLKHSSKCRCDDCTDALPRLGNNHKKLVPLYKEFNGGLWLVYHHYEHSDTEWILTLNAWRKLPIYVLP